MEDDLNQFEVDGCEFAFKTGVFSLDAGVEHDTVTNCGGGWPAHG